MMRLQPIFKSLASVSIRSFCAEAAPSLQDELRVTNQQDNLAGIKVLSMNRPKAMNAISKNMLQLFAENVSALKHDRSVRVVIIRSEVKGAFCAGADLKERAKMAPEDVPAFVSRARQLMADLESLPQPVLAAMDGVALGGGLEMALACDIRIAASTAKMGLTETRLAIIPGAGGTQRLPRVIGVPKAKEMIFTGRVVDGTTAHSLGLVNQVVEQSENSDAAYQQSLVLAQEIISSGPVAVSAAKTAISLGSEVDLSAGLEIEKLCYAQVIPTSDRLEALMAFREKRAPKFTGN